MPSAPWCRVLRVRGGPLGAVLLVLMASADEAASLTARPGASAGPQAPEDAGAEAVSIEEFYERASAADDLFPGARRGSSHISVKGMHWTFLNNRWNDLYFDRKKKGDEFRAILKSDTALDFTRFDQFCRWNRADFFKVVVFNEGYLLIAPESLAHKLVVPIPRTIAIRLEEFLRPDAPPPSDERKKIRGG